MDAGTGTPSPTRSASRRVLVVLAVVLALTAAIALVWPRPDPEPTESALEGTELASAVQAVNDAAAAEGYGLAVLTVDDVAGWFEDAKSFELLRLTREEAWGEIQAGGLPGLVGVGLVVQEPEDEVPPTPVSFELWGPDELTTGEAEIRIMPFNLPIVDGSGFVPYAAYLERLLGPDLDLADEAFEGQPAPDLAALDPVVQVRVTPIEVQGVAKAEPAQRAALEVMIRLAPDALDAAADYFGTGFGREAVRARMAELLGEDPERWVDVASLIPGWVGEKANTFPLGSDTDVCYGAAREFFAAEQDARHNQSTEASSLLLDGHYCLLAEDVAPVFGDYLSVPNQHAGRYVLRDPATGRDVSFSVQSGGNAPYRFAWLDEDFSTRPFAGVADPTVLESRVDVWRRCR